MTGALTLGACSPRFRSATTAVRITRSYRTMQVLAFAAVDTAVRAPSSRSLYEVLRVKETASPTEIKAAYRSLAKRFHPDTAAASASSTLSGSGEDFIEIHRAYATLSDPSARAQYDLSTGRFRFSGEDWPRTRRWESDQCW